MSNPELDLPLRPESSGHYLGSSGGEYPRPESWRIAQVEIDAATIEVFDYEVDHIVHKRLSHPGKFLLSVPLDGAWRQQFTDSRGCPHSSVGTDMMRFIPPATGMTLKWGPGRINAFSCMIDVQNDFLTDIACREVLSRAIDSDSIIYFKSSRIKRIVGQLIREMDSQQLGSMAMCRWLLSMILVDVIRQISNGLAGRRPTSIATWQLRRVEQQIVDQCPTIPRLGVLAAQCGISERHLMRGYKAARGQTLGAFARQVQIAMAQRLLAQGDQSIACVADSMGFASPSGFSVAFHRSTGMRPLGYRQRSRAATVNEDGNSPQLKPLPAT